MEQIKKACKLLTTPVVVTNYKEFSLELTSQKQVKLGDSLFTLDTK
jgi:PTS system beta-glucosides-specific IIC component